MKNNVTWCFFPPRHNLHLILDPWVNSPETGPGVAKIKHLSAVKVLHRVGPTEVTVANGGEGISGEIKGSPEPGLSWTHWDPTWHMS